MASNATTAANIEILRVALRIVLGTTAKSTSCAPPPPPDRRACEQQQQRQADQKSDANHAEGALTELQLPIRRTLVRNLDQRVVFEQPVEHTLAEFAVAAIAKERVRQEIAVADHHGA